MSVPSDPNAHDGLFTAFQSALMAMDCEGSQAAQNFLQEHGTNVARALSRFGSDGRLIGGEHLPATCYNDFYKWTMFPVMATVERAFGDVRCTFSVNIRDAGYRKQLCDSATGRTSPALFEEVKASLDTLTKRRFDRNTFERILATYKLPGWDTELIDKLCGSSSSTSRTLVQEFVTDLNAHPVEPKTTGDVYMQLFVAFDQKLKEERVFIEATGPWHRVTWLETSMMQAVYEALLRDRKRKEYGKEDSAWFPQWLAECLCRCVRSIAAAVQSGMPGILMTSRRTGGLPLIILQGLYAQQAFRGADGKPMLLGSSSVTACYECLDAGVQEEYVPKCAGTHAHELSMVIGAILGDVDDKAGMPLSQIVGHLLYFYKSRPEGNVQEPARKPLMPMLSDTLGTRAFMKVASMLTVPFGPHQDQPILSIIGAARQDSGGLDDFANIMNEFGFKGALLASEIETAEDLFTARDNGFKIFGAGGYMGDSEKAWDASKTNISMAAKVLRVFVNGRRTPIEYGPVKTGETGNEGKIKEGKFEADGILSAAEVAAVHRRAQLQANAEPRLTASDMQRLLVETLLKFPGVAPAGYVHPSRLSSALPENHGIACYPPGFVSRLKSLAHEVGIWIGCQVSSDGNAADKKMSDIEKCWKLLSEEDVLPTEICHQIRDIAVSGAALTLAKGLQWEDVHEYQKDFEAACEPPPEEVCAALWRRTQDLFLSLARMRCAKCRDDTVGERQEQRVYDRHVRNLAGLRKVNVAQAVPDRQQSFSDEAAKVIPANVVMLSTCIDGPSANSPRTPYTKGVEGRCTETLTKALEEFGGRTWMELLWAMRRLTVQAESRERQVPVLSSSRCMDLNIPFSVKHPKPSGRCRALLIGINYSGQEGLGISSGHKDVKHMQTYLLGQGYEETQIKILADDGVNESPTRSAIEEGMTWLVKGSGPGDSLFFHYSGHGSTFAGDTSVDKDDPFFGGAAKESDEALCPVDFRQAGMIFDDEVFRYLISPLQEGVLLTCVVDCCQSGTILHLPYAFKAESARLDNIAPGDQPPEEVAMTPNADYDPGKMLQVIQSHPAMCAAAVFWAKELAALDPARHEEQLGAVLSQEAFAKPFGYRR